MKIYQFVKSRIFLVAAAITQALSVIVLFFSLTAKKKNPIAAILAILALESGVSLFLMAHLHKDLSALTMSGNLETPETVEVEPEEAPEAPEVEEEAVAAE